MHRTQLHIQRCPILFDKWAGNVIPDRRSSCTCRLHFFCASLLHFAQYCYIVVAMELSRLGGAHREVTERKKYECSRADPGSMSRPVAESRPLLAVPHLRRTMENGHSIAKNDEIVSSKLHRVIADERVEMACFARRLEIVRGRRGRPHYALEPCAVERDAARVSLTRRFTICARLRREHRRSLATTPAQSRSACSPAWRTRDGTGFVRQAHAAAGTQFHFRRTCTT